MKTARKWLDTQVLEVCRRTPKLRVLKLFKNQIDDNGAEGIAELCKTCPGIEERRITIDFEVLREDMRKKHEKTSYLSPIPVSEDLLRPSSSTISLGDPPLPQPLHG